MTKNGSAQVFYFLPLFDKGHKKWNSSLEGLLASRNIKKLSIPHLDEVRSFFKDESYSKTLPQYENEAEEGISQIQDPLWSRICMDIHRVLGPIVFQDLWKIKLETVSPEGKRAYLSCPTQALAATIEQYHFVIIGALKKFYPSLSSLETKIKEA